MHHTRPHISHINNCWLHSRWWISCWCWDWSLPSHSPSTQWRPHGRAICGSGPPIVAGTVVDWKLKLEKHYRVFFLKWNSQLVRFDEGKQYFLQSEANQFLPNVWNGLHALTMGKNPLWVTSCGVAAGDYPDQQLSAIISHDQVQYIVLPSTSTKEVQQNHGYIHVNIYKSHIYIYITLCVCHMYLGKLTLIKRSPEFQVHVSLFWERAEVLSDVVRGCPGCHSSHPAPEYPWLIIV